MKTALQQAAQALIYRWDTADWKSTKHTAEYVNALRKALKAEQAQVVEPAGVFDIAMTEKMAVIDYDCTKHSLKSGDKLYTHPAPPAGEQIDWQDMYLKAKSEKEAMAAKYDKDIGPLASMAPVSCGYDETTGNCTSNQCCYTPAVTGERAELIAKYRRFANAARLSGQSFIPSITSGELLELCDMLEAHAEFKPDWVGYRQGVEDGKAEAQQVAVPVPMSDSQIESLREKTFSTGNPYCPVDSKSMRKAARAIEAHHGIGAKPETEIPASATKTDWSAA